MGGAGKLAPNAGVWPWRSPETDTIRRKLRGRGRSWETGTSCGCLALAGVGNGYHPGGNSGNVGRAGKLALRAGTWPRRSAARAGRAGKLASLVRQAEQGPSIPYMEGPCPIVPKQNAPPTNDTPAKGCRNEHAGQHRDDGKPCEPALCQVTACQVTASPGALASAGTPLVKQGTPLIKCMREAHVARRPGARVGQGNHAKKAARSQRGLRGIEMALLEAISIPRLQ